MKHSKYDMILNILCLVMLVAMTLFLIIRWKMIPAEVPMHHNLAGEIDRWGSKSEIILLPIMAWGIYLLLSVVERFPRLWNTGVKITERNKYAVYRTLKHLLTTIKWITVGIFAYLTVETALAAPLSGWFLPVTGVILFGTILLGMWKLYRLR